MQMRVACSALIYRKVYNFPSSNLSISITSKVCDIVVQSLRLSQRALGEATTGQMVNLLSTDVSRLEICFLHYIWIGPIQLAIVIYILWGYFGWACLAGGALIVIFVPFQSGLYLPFGGTTIRRSQDAPDLREIVLY
jgi:ATP-binding cassette subfamily C (CFTR/MRP) protein 4